LLDGSNARFYTLKFCLNEATTVEECDAADVDFWQIGTDGGYLTEPVNLGNELTIAPGERGDVLVDLSNLDANDVVYLRNFAVTPFPYGDPVDENTAAVMKFVGTGASGADFPDFPDCMNPTLQPLCDDSNDFPTIDGVDNSRILVLKEVMNKSAGEPVMVTLNGQKWSADISELPILGTTEEWVIVNPTADAHPIHLHLVQFQLVSRQNADIETYSND
jgi:spore coat protein A